jgi:ATP/maltotriose-dependent transcriptional regulator MalT
VLSVLTHGKRISVINAPAGSGKTRVTTVSPRHPGRRVAESHNIAQFLGHLSGQ